MQLNLALMNARRPIGVKTVRLFFGLVALAAVLVAAPMSSATAAGPQGLGKFKFSYGKAGKSLNNQGAKFSPLAQTKFKYMKGPRLNVNSKVETVSIKTVSGTPAAKVQLRGGVAVFKGKGKLRRKLRLGGAIRGGLVLKADPDGLKINAKVGGKVRTVFVATGSNSIDADLGTLKVGWTKLNLSKGMARTIKKRLKLKRLPAAQVGSFSATAQGAFEDPYLELCGLSASSRTLGTVPVADVPPVLSGAVATVGEPVTWGFKASFNGYLNAFGGATGLDGATVNPYPGPPNPSVPPKDFTFPFVEGQYAANQAGTADDQAVLNGSGTVVYCNEPHGFRIAISNPTVVIDGASSRLIADVDTNISGDWMPTQRVDLADLDVPSVTPTSSGPAEVSWPAIPATLSEDGSDALRLCEVNVPGAPPGCLYPAGTELDALTVTAATQNP